MNIDAEEHLAAVERSVSILERDGQPVGAVSLSRSFDTTLEDLWEALTGPERIPRWFLPVSGDLKLGGRYQLEGNAGGIIIACERLSHFSLTWEFGGDTSWVDVRLHADRNELPRLALTHTAHLSEHWHTYGPGAVGVGWEMALMGLALHIARPDEPMPDETAFATSGDGRMFIAGSSDRWRQQSVVSGTAPEVAAAASKRTIAFYTGEPEETS